MSQEGLILDGDQAGLFKTELNRVLYCLVDAVHDLK
jgi:hypothetical protein